MSKKVLVVEDNPQNMAVMLMTLKPQGYTLLEAADGEAALRTVESEKPDLVLLDIQLPDMNGIEVIKRLRQMPEFRSNPIIAVTAYAMKGDKEIAIEAGCDAYLAKPFSIYELRRVVDDTLSQHQKD